LKQSKNDISAEQKNCRFDRRCAIVSSIDLCKKIIFENFVTYEGLHGQRRIHVLAIWWTSVH